MTVDLPPSLVGTSWDTPEGRRKYARLVEDPPEPEQLVEPEAWLGRAVELLRFSHPSNLLVRDDVLAATEAARAVARSLAEAYAAGLYAGELRG